MPHEKNRFDQIRDAIEGKGALFYRAHLPGKGRKSGDRLVFTCPLHAEKDASFNTYDDGRYHCFGCQAHGDAIDFIRATRGCTAQAAAAAVEQWLGLAAGSQRPASTGRGSVHYEIRDVDGRLQATHVRTDRPDGKQFRWVNVNGKNGLGGRSQNTLPLYNTHRLRTWPTTDPVLIVEGEKTADHITSAGLPCLATLGASTVPDASALAVLRDRDIVLWSDDDTPGREHMRRVAEALHDLAIPCRMITSQGETKDDACDLVPVADRLVIEEIIALSAEPFMYDAAAYENPADDLPPPKAAPVAPFAHTTLETVAANLAETTWLWPSYIPRGYLTILAGEPGCGKSGLALWLAKTALEGGIWPNGVEHGEPLEKVLWLETDDCHGALRDRALAWALPLADLLMLGHDGMAQIDLGGRGALRKLAQLVAECRVGFVVIDTLAGAHEQDENSSTIKGMISTVAKLAQQCNIPVLATHHLRKRSALETGASASMDRVRGSTAISAGARSILGLDRFKSGTIHQEGPEKVRLMALKANLCPLPPGLVFAQSEHGLEFEEMDEKSMAQMATAPLTNSAVEIMQQAILSRLAEGPASRQDLIAVVHTLGYSEMSFQRAQAGLTGLVRTMRGKERWFELPTAA